MSNQFEERSHGVNHRRSIRLKEYDYSWAAWYYVTICTGERKCFFGSIADERMVASATGSIVEEQWAAIPRHFPGTELDAYVVMPNHLHGIVILNDDPRRGLINQTPTKTGSEKTASHWQLMKNPALTLGKVIRAFKARVAREVHTQGYQDFSWQRGFYEHVIRNDIDLHRIRTYISNNPLQWSLDNNYPENFPS